MNVEGRSWDGIFVVFVFVVDFARWGGMWFQVVGGVGIEGGGRGGGVWWGWGGGWRL